MTRRTTRAGFTRDAAEVAAEASEDALAREIAGATFHKPQRAPRSHPRAFWAVHGVTAAGLTAAAAQTGAVLPCLAAGLGYGCAVALWVGHDLFGGGSWRAYYAQDPDD